MSKKVVVYVYVASLCVSICNELTVSSVICVICVRTARFRTRGKVKK